MKLKIIVLFTFYALIPIHGQTNDEWLHFEYGNSPLPSDGVNCIAVDSLNNKWFGTYLGLAKFDGVNWEIFNKDNGLVHNRVEAIAVDKDNNIWIFDSLLSKYNGHEWKHYHPSEYLNAPKGSRVLAIDENNVKWMTNEPYLGDQRDLISFNDTTFHIYNRAVREELSIINTLKISGIIKWIGTYSGLLMYDDTKWINCGRDTASQSWKYSFRVEAMDIDMHKTIWIFGFVDELEVPYDLPPTFYRYILNGTNDWEPIPMDIPYGPTSVITADKDGNKWIGMDGHGLYKLNDDSIIQLSALTYSTFSAIEIDKFNNKWIGHWANGVSVYREGGVIFTSLDDNKNNFCNVEFNLSQNFPNPFNPITIIKYTIPKTDKVDIKIFNILGEELITLISETKQAGTYQVEFNGSEFSSGIYFYTLVSGDNIVDTKKFILLK